MNYQKTIFSLITTAFLSITAIGDGLATYLPLTTSTNDGSWILFGVNGFSDGRASSRSAVAAGFSTDYVELEDTNPQDAIATWGLSASNTPQPATDNLMAVQGIDDSSISTLKVATKVLQPFVELEAIRSMYIRVDSITPNVKIDYKASMEGQTLEIFIGTISPLYSVKISQENTYNNPAEAIESVRVAASVVKLSSITDVIDYQLGNNPLDAKYFSKTTHQDDSISLSFPAETATFYHFDAISQQWKIWNTNFAGLANDFTSFSKGDAYWGRIDVDDNPINNDGTIGSGIIDSNGNNILGSGLVLGKSGEAVPDENVYIYDDNTTKLIEGWNLLSFDAVRPYIRRAATGLVVTSLASAGTIILTDSTRMNSIKITLTAVAVNLQAKEINRAIEIAKLKRILPNSFNIRAFASSSNIVFISDAKFTLEDETGTDNLTVIKTLTGNNPYNEFGVQTENFTNLDSNTSGQSLATSAYGEYSIIVDIMTDDLTGGATAASLDSLSSGSGEYVSAKLAFGTTSRNYASIALGIDNDSQPNVSTAKTSIESHPLFDRALSPVTSYGKAIKIDSLNDGSEDKIIISATEPFYIKDSTYTRVFDYNETTGDNSRRFEVIGSHGLTVKPTLAQSVVSVAAFMNDNADENEERTGVYAGVDGTKLVAVSTTLSTFDIKDLEDGNNEFFKVSTSNSDISKGAVKGVYALDTIAKMSLINHQWEVSGFVMTNTEINDVTDTFQLTTSSGVGAFIDPNSTTPSLVDDPTDPTARESWFDLVVADVNAKITTAGDHGYAYHNYVAADDNLTTAKIMIIGMEIDSTAIAVGGDFVSPVISDINNATVSTLGTSWTSITPDLKSNAIYTPNYATHGPLYTLRKAGFDTKAMLKATTNISDMSIGWDSIDLTRDESNWFKNNEFNLFSINHNSGYWVYLVEDANDTITINQPNYKATYTYYFDNIDSNGEYVTSNIINGGQFSVEISGVDNQISSAFVSINGEEVQLKRNGFSDEFTAEFTKYALKSFNESKTGPISMTIRATNGKGEAATKYEAYKLDYTAPTMNASVALDINKTLLSAEGNATKFYVYREYIPELYSSRVDADKKVNRFVGKYDSNSSGQATIELCKELTFGDVDNLRVVAADGTGEIGFSNLSNAIQFEYATMLKDVHVLKDEGGDTNQTIIGLRYDSLCNISATQPVTVDDNNGISLKVVDDDNLTARLSYEVIPDVTLSASVPWVSSYSIAGEAVIQLQNVVEYRSKPFFLQYNNKTYVSAFPADSSAASASLDSNATAIKLDDAITFSLNGDGDSNGGSGNEISILNNALIIP